MLISTHRLLSTTASRRPPLARSSKGIVGNDNGFPRLSGEILGFRRGQCWVMKKVLDISGQQSYIPAVPAH
jgi:hypothetical protein